MRRIPRCSRSIDPSATSSKLLRPQISHSQCRLPITVSPLLRSTSAPFSTSTRYNSILPGNQDRKKHQQFVRRWQKRLLGDSEPIGAHVDPYDGTSPVRISPEEQGEEVEVMAGQEMDEHGNVINDSEYHEARTGEGLRSVGGREWIEQREEMALLERYTKLVAPSEDGYGLVNYSFGPEEKVKDISLLKSLFHQAVVEVYTLRQNRTRIIFPPQSVGTADWTRDVKLRLAANGDVLLANAQAEDVNQFVSAIRELSAKNTQPAQPVLVEEIDGSVAAPEGEVLNEAVKTKAKSAPATTTTSTKKPESKPFDFMSNRPVPRAEAKEATIEKETVEAVEVLTRATTPTEAATNAVPAAQDSPAAVPSATPTSPDSTGTEQVGASIPTSDTGVDAKYRHISLTNPFIKFPIAKRLLQLTGHRISDPVLNASSTLADLFSALITASDPKPTKLKAIVDYETKLRHIRSQDRKTNATSKKQQPIDLTSLPNVKFSKKRLSYIDKEKEVGRWKVIEYALAERGLPVLKKDAREPKLRPAGHADLSNA